MDPEAPSDVAQDAPGRLPGVVKALSWGLLVAAALLGLAGLAAPHQASYVEGFLLEQGLRLSEGGALYRPLEAGPWIVDNFPPLYPLVLAPLAGAFGATFWWGRLLTLAAVAGLAVLLYRWSVIRPGSGRGAAGPTAVPPEIRGAAGVALAVTALWVLSPYVLRRALLLRMDFAALLLAAFGTFLLVRRPERRSTVPAAALLFLLALLGRQTMIAAPAASLVALLSAGRRRDALRLALLLASGGLVALALLQAVTEGRFLTHAVAYNGGRWIWLNWLEKSGATLLLHVPLALLAAVGARAAWRDRTLEARLPVLWLLFAIPATLTIGKAGSTYNHFLEMVWVAALNAARGVPEAAAALRRLAPHLVPAAPALSAARLLLAALAVQALVAGATPPLHTAVGALTGQSDEARLVETLAATPGPVLSENAGALLQSGHEVLLEPRTLSELARAARWDPAPLHENLSRAAYALLVIETLPPPSRCEPGCRWDPESWRIIEDRYGPSETVGRWQLWRPLPSG